MAGPSFAYLVMCHTDPAGVLRLVRRIRSLSPDCAVLVRYDVPGLFDDGAIDAAGGVPLESGIRVHWGEWSQVAMQLEVLRVARDRTPADRYVLMSGQDHPIRDLQRWEDELVADGAEAFLEPLVPQPRDHEFTWTVAAEPGWIPAAVRRLARGAVTRVAPATRAVLDVYPVARGSHPARWWVGTPRRGTPPVPPVKASSWSVLSAHAVEVVLARAAERPEIPAFFRTVRTPDEYVIPSIVASAGLRCTARATAHKSFPPGDASPCWVDAEMIAGLPRGQAAFIRKIPPHVSPSVLAAADALVAEEQAEQVQTLGSDAEGAS